MNRVFVKSLLRNRYVPAVISGLLLAAAFPKIGIAGLGWVAPGLILATALGTTGGKSFRIGFVAGLAHYLASLSWLLRIPVVGFPILGWIALSSFLALFPGAWVWFCVRSSGISSLLPQRTPAVSHRVERTWLRRILWASSCAAAWVAMEMIIARIFGGFPWNLLGASQFQIIPLIQIASVTGVYGISFLLVWTSVSLLNSFIAIVQQPNTRSVWSSEVILPLAAIAGTFAFGFHELGRTNASTQSLKISLVQPSIPQTMIWDQRQDAERFQELIHLSEQALTNQPDLLIWPEAAVPGYARWDTNIYPAITNLAEQHHVWMIVGSDDAAPASRPGATQKYEYYNACFLVSPDGEFVNRYRKRSLVMFGEYIPLERWLPFVKWFTPVTGSFTPGDKAVPFNFTAPSVAGQPPSGEPGTNDIGVPKTFPISASVLICFEDNFPHLVREYAEADTDFLVNITNNGWFGEGAAQWQHAANAVFRAIENRRPLVRCTNNGLTCWVDVHGRLREIFRDANGRIYGPGILTIDLPLPTIEQRRSPTFYNQYGDVFGWACAGLTAIRVVASLSWFGKTNPGNVNHH